MGFAYKPIRFDDLTAINTVNHISEITTSYDHIAEALAKSPPNGLILLDGFPTANFPTLLAHLR